MYSDQVDRNAQLVYRLMGLGMACTVLHIGAHPDDEDTGMLAYLARKFGGRAVYWSATRGEGGQNRIGPYREQALGVYRTWESLAARAVDGGECLFGPFYDFGYSKNGEEALAKWGRRTVIREVVRAIRLIQPHIVVSRWTGTPRDLHGHHQAIGQATLEAFEAAGDPAQFPELRAQGLAAWCPLKLYHSTRGDWNPGEEGAFGRIDPALERDGVLRINTGEFDPIRGRTYQEQAWMALNKHQTQGIGMAPAPGDYFYYYSLHKSLVPVPDRESSFFDGLDPSLAGLADYPGNGSPSLREKLLAIKAQANEALRRFRADDPLEAATLLLESLSALRETGANLAEENLNGKARQALALYLARKIVDFEEVAAQCLGIELECLSERSRLIPGQRFRMAVRLWNHRRVRIDHARFTPRLPEGWEARSLEPEDADHGKLSEQWAAAFEVIAPEMADLTCPYWLVKPREGYVYHWPAGEPCSRPFGAAQVQVECEVAIGPHRIILPKAVVHREAFPGGFRELPLAVIPPISLHPETTQAFLQAKKTKRQAVCSTRELEKLLAFLEESFTDQPLELQVVARNNSDRAVEGNLALEVPPGWKVTPERVQLSLAEAGGAQTVRFTVTVPANTPEGHYPLRYKVRYGQRDYAVVLTPVRMGAPGLAALTDGSCCLKEEFIITPSQVMVHLIAAQFAPGLRYAYIQGAKEELLEALKPFGIAFHLITDAEMGYLDLSTFEAVVVGPNAYLLREELRKNAARFLEYVKQGGTLIVQYQGYGYQHQGFTPYPFRYSQPHDRVTHEDAPVKLLAPDHLLFCLPNAIGAADFEGWIHDRGLYFFGEWDKRYKPLLSCCDPGEEPHQGGLLECQYGRGTFLYTGYSFFRQLPAAVPGAFRLFANILALPTARIVERIEFIKQTPLFSTLTDEQLNAVVQIMTERWEENGVTICRQGEVGHELYIVYRGELEIIKESNGQEQIVARAQAGDCLGELALMGNVTHTASLRARGDVHLLVIEDTHFQALVHQHPEVAIQMMKFLASRQAGFGG